MFPFFQVLIPNIQKFIRIPTWYPAKLANTHIADCRRYNYHCCAAVYATADDELPPPTPPSPHTTHRHTRGKSRKQIQTHTHTHTT